MDDNTTVSPVDHDSDFKLHDEIMNTSQELSRIYDSLVSKIKKNNEVLVVECHHKF